MGDSTAEISEPACRSLAVCSNLEDRHAKDDIDAWTKGWFLEGQVAACVSYGWRIILLVVGRAVIWVLRGLAQPLRSAYTLLRTGNGLKVYIWAGGQSKCPGQPGHLVSKILQHLCL